MASLMAAREKKTMILPHLLRLIFSAKSRQSIPNYVIEELFLQLSVVMILSSIVTTTVIIVLD